MTYHVVLETKDGPFKGNRTPMGFANSAEFSDFFDGKMSDGKTRLRDVYRVVSHYDDEKITPAIIAPPDDIAQDVKAERERRKNPFPTIASGTEFRLVV